jgi:hypothetical protein
MATEIRLAHWQGIKLDYLIILNYEKGLFAQNKTNVLPKSFCAKIILSAKRASLLLHKKSYFNEVPASLEEFPYQRALLHEQGDLLGTPVEHIPG